MAKYEKVPIISIFFFIPHYNLRIIVIVIIRICLIECNKNDTEIYIKLVVR